MSRLSQKDRDFLYKTLTCIFTGNFDKLSKSEKYEYRKSYIRLIEADNPMNTLIEIMKKIVMDNKLQLSNNNNLTIKHESKTLEFNQPVITIGRLPCCTIKIKDMRISRIHCLVFVFDEFIFITDPGSLCGLKIKTYNPKNEFIIAPKNGGVIKLARDEYFELSIYYLDSKLNLNLVVSTLVFQPKICMVCMVNARDYLADCGHFTMCKNCAKQIKNKFCNKCPVCNISMGSGHYNKNFLKTFVKK